MGLFEEASPFHIFTTVLKSPSIYHIGENSGWVYSYRGGFPFYYCATVHDFMIQSQVISNTTSWRAQCTQLHMLTNGVNLYRHMTVVCCLPTLEKQADVSSDLTIPI